MGMTKALLDERDAAKVDKRAKGRNRSKGGGYVDIRPDSPTKDAVKVQLERFPEVFETFRRCFDDSRMKCTIKYDGRNACWQMNVCDGTKHYKNATYYVFRHKDIGILFALFLYVMQVQWGGVLPREIDNEDDVNW